MVTKEQIQELVNAHLGRVLRVAQSALPETQFHAFRRVALDEFGRNGFRRNLARLLGTQQDNNKQASGWQNPAGKEDDHV